MLTNFFNLDYSCQRVVVDYVHSTFEYDDPSPDARVDKVFCHVMRESLSGGFAIRQFHAVHYLAEYDQRNMFYLEVFKGVKSKFDIVVDLLPPRDNFAICNELTARLPQKELQIRGDYAISIGDTVHLRYYMECGYRPSEDTFNLALGNMFTLADDDLNVMPLLAETGRIFASWLSRQRKVVIQHILEPLIKEDIDKWQALADHILDIAELNADGELVQTLTHIGVRPSVERVLRVFEVTKTTHFAFPANGEIPQNSMYSISQYYHGALAYNDQMSTYAQFKKLDNVMAMKLRVGITVHPGL